jgi:hypothetical protein
MTDQTPDHRCFWYADADATIRQPEPPRIVILGEDDRTPLVTIHPSGVIEYGPGYEPDAAARRFWDAMRYYMPARCPSCGHVGLETAEPDQMPQEAAVRPSDATAVAERPEYERAETAEDLAEQHARNTLTVARERDSYRKAWKDEQQRRARAEAELKRLRQESPWLKATAEDLATVENREMRAVDAIARVRDLHYRQGAYCAICTEDFGRLNAAWPCDTIRALAEPKEQL